MLVLGGVESKIFTSLFFIIIMLGIGILYKAILKGIKRGKKIKVIKRYLYMYHNIKIGEKALINRYEQIKRIARKGV